MIVVIHMPAEFQPQESPVMIVLSQGHKAIWQFFPNFFTLQIALERPQISSARQCSSCSSCGHLCGQYVMLWECKWLDYGSSIEDDTVKLSSHAMHDVLCPQWEKNYWAGWSKWKPCKPPASVDKLHNFWGRQNLLFIRWKVALKWRWCILYESF